MLLVCVILCVFFFKQKTAYEMRISDWSSDVCSSDLGFGGVGVVGVGVSPPTAGVAAGPPPPPFERGPSLFQLSGSPGSWPAKMRLICSMSIVSYLSKAAAIACSLSRLPTMMLLAVA